MPTPPPPPVNPAPQAVSESVSEDAPKEDDSLAVAALIDLAGRSALVADQTGDVRLKRVSDFIISEVQKSGAIRDLVKALASQSGSPSPADSVAQRREEERDQRSREWQESLQARQVNQRKQAELMEKLAEALIQKAINDGNDK